MKFLRYVFVWGAILVAGSACAAPQQTGNATPAVDRETITPEEFGQRNFYSAYDAVAALRPSWLNKRGFDAEIQVYIDDNPAGGLEALRRIRIASVQRIRHMDGIQASARYGPGHDQGAILVTTVASGR